MRARRLRLMGLVGAIALAGPWTTAHADDWPVPDRAAGHGVMVANMTFHSSDGIGLRMTLKKAGEVDILTWAGFTERTVKSDEKISTGALMWNVLTPRSPMYTAYGDQWSTSSDFYVNDNGHTVTDSRSPAGGGAGGDAVGMDHVPAGTYDLVLWTAANTPHIDARYRVHAPKGTKLVHRSVSTRTFNLAQRDFSGTASVDANVAPFDGATALVNESAHIAVRTKFFGAFSIPPGFGAPVALGSYTGPTGTHTVQDDVMFNGTPAGGYTFTVNAGTDGEPLVTGVDIGVP